MITTKRHGRLLDDFHVGDLYVHPWEVTVDEGMLALFYASFQCAVPTYASRAAARSLGLADRPIHPLLLLNLGISFSVQDVSERVIAHLAYIDVRFPNACYAGATLRASSRVIGVKPASTGDKGVVHVHTDLVTDEGALACSFDRKVLVRAGSLGVPRPPPSPEPDQADVPRIPVSLSTSGADRSRRGFATYFEDFEVGDVLLHDTGRTVSEAESMQLTTLVRNSHPLHLDEVYCKTGSFAKTRVVYGGLVLAWVLALASRDTAGSALWDAGLDDGAHPSGVLPGDTLFSASKVIAKEERDGAGIVSFRVVGLKNAHPRAFAERHAELFEPELGKAGGKVPEKVVEITRSLLLPRRPR